MEAEEFFRISPSLDGRPTGVGGKFGKLAKAVFIRVLRNDPFSRGEANGLPIQANTLLDQADERHFNSPKFFVITGAMPERLMRQIGTKHPIDPR